MQRLMDELGASRATVVRDLGYLRDFMGAPLVYDRERNGYRYDADSPEFELPGLWFNDTELYALLASEQLLESVQPGLLGPYIGPLKSRIRKLLEQTGHSASTVMSRVMLRPFARRTVDDEVFGQVSAAVLAGRMLDFSYRGRERGTATQRHVHPYRLLQYRDNWYLVAYCEQARDLRTFSLDRIDHPQDAGCEADLPDEQALDRYLGASFGIFTGEASEWAVLRFTPERARWVADEQWHPDQIGQWVADAYELQIPYSDARELLMDILKYGADVEVIAPPALRTLVAEGLQRAAARYTASPEAPQPPDVDVTKT